MGNIFVCGHTTGNLDGVTKTGVRDAFVTKYDSAGVKQWTKLLGVAGMQTMGMGIAKDSFDNIYVAGRTYGGLDGNVFAGQLHDAFVAKYDSNGTKKWTKQFGYAASNTAVVAIAVDSADNIFLTGNTNGNLDGNSVVGVNSVFVASYDGSGTKQWTRQLGAIGGAVASSEIVMGTSGDIYLSGSTDVGLDGNTLVGTSDAFLTVIWQ